MYRLRQILVILSCLTLSLGLRSFPQYTKDFSEHCMRRDALPSVFLSRKVMDADSQVLHFSRLEIPYSCFTSVRTEAGHSIIMVVELSHNDMERNFCNDGYQIAVFEFAETFGGYWGPIPDGVLKQDPQDPVYTKQYTLADKPPPVTTTTTIQTTSSSMTSSKTSRRPTEVTQDYITIEVPLVNLSGSLEPFQQEQLTKPFDMDDFFDDFYDVVPRPGQPYKTSILPLVQIAVKEQEGITAGDDGKPRYELDYAVGPFTPDHRLTTPAWSTSVNTNRNSNRWKKKKLPQHHTKTNVTRDPKDISSRKFFRKQFSLPAASHGTHRPTYEHIFPQKNTVKSEDAKQKVPFNLIENIMDSLNESGVLKTQEQSTNNDVLEIFDKTENRYGNLSVYLEPFSTEAFLPVSYTLGILANSVLSTINLEETTERVKTINESQDPIERTREIPVMAYNTNKIIKIPDHHDVLELNSVTKEEITTPPNQMDTIDFPSFTGDKISGGVIEISSYPNVETNIHEVRSGLLEAGQPLADDVLIPVITTGRSLSGTLVDHESWENVVQSAPVMAGLLNQHGAELRGSYSKPDEVSAQSKPRSRRKRHIAAIMVDDARPHSRPTTRLPTIEPIAFNILDVHEFARLIELPDDQMNNHVMIKLNPKTNTQLFNICNSNVTKFRYLVVFNSSRIILSIGNFYLQHAMVTLTSARPLALMEQQCPADMVECQVEGTRLCIDSTNACNGIPNCGSQSAYDEDRVMCGVIDSQPSVYLAAATCLAVLITMLYITHYWLRRCVPNVAEAFFVYSDNADNELYLDSIMRSPMDVDGGQNMYNSALFDEENMLYQTDTRKSQNIFKRLLSSVLPNFTLFKQQDPLSKSLEIHGIGRSVSREVPELSFTESDLRSMLSAGRDQEVQTGESLEMAYLKVLNTLKDDIPDEKPTKPRLPSFHHIVMRDFLKAQISKSSSDSAGPSRVSASRPGLEEKELHSTLYDPGVPGTSKTTQSEKKKASDARTQRGKKCLRFNERTTYIPRENDEGVESTEIEESSKRKRKNNDGNNAEHGGSDFRNLFRKKKDHK